MATVAPRSPAKAGPIPVRTIGDEDLRWSLRQGWEDFRDLRGDLFFAGLIYTLIGIAAVVMTTSRPLMPFFFPVVAGVALLGPVAAVGFYELARRREAARRSTGSTSSTCASVRPSTTWGSSRDCCC